MARQCPSCLTKVPATKVVAYSGNIGCPSCKSSLEPSPFTRNISAYTALVVGALVLWKSSIHYSLQQGALWWVFPILFAYLAYSIAAPLMLVLMGDLQLRPLEPEQPGHEPLAPDYPSPQHHHPSH